MKKILITTLLLLVMMMTLIACGSDNTASDTEVMTPATDQTAAAVTDDSTKPDDAEVSVETGNTKEPVEPNDTEAPIEPDEPVVEMVSWEEWATQADNDEVCLVVWNEKTSTQKLLQSIGEKDVNSYTVQEGDKFSVPKRDNIDFITIEYANKDSSTDLFWSSTDKPYWEFELPVDEIMYVFIIRNDNNIAVTYCFNF